MSALRFRIGLHLGEVIEKSDGTVYGDGVNIAARLESLAQPGGVMVSASVYGALSDATARHFEFAGEHRVKNVGRPLIAYQRNDIDVAQDDAAADNELRQSSVKVQAGTARSPRKRRLLSAILALGVIVGAVLLARFAWIERNVLVPVEQMPLALPEKPSVAVLPLQNSLGSEDLIADLAKVSGLFVIGPRSSFAHRDRESSTAEFARDLSVRYVLRGEVSNDDSVVNANIRLVDVVSGDLLWRENFNVSPDSMVSVTSKIARRIVNSLDVTLTRAESGTYLVPATAVPQAFEQAMYGRALFVQQSPEAFAKAIVHLERAVAADAQYAIPYGVLATIYWQSLRRGWQQKLGLDRETLRERALKYRDLSLRHPTPMGLIVASDIELWAGRHADAEALIGQATLLAPNNAQVKLKLAEILALAGEHERALRHQAEAARLDPYDRARQAYVRGIAQFGLERHQLASESLSQALDLNPSAGRPAVFAAAAFGFLGRADEAEDALAPYLTRSWTQGGPASMARGFPFRQEQDRQRLASGLSQAGITAR